MISKKPSLAAALREATGRSRQLHTGAEQQDHGERQAAGNPGRPKVIAGHFDPAVSKQLKLLALEQDTNLQELLAEAINDLFDKVPEGDDRMNAAKRKLVRCLPGAASSPGTITHP